MTTMIPVETPMFTYAYAGDKIFAADQAGNVYRQGRSTYTPTGFLLSTRGYVAGSTSRHAAGDMLTALVSAQF